MEASPPTLRLLLTGPSGGGKTALANAIMGRRILPEGIPAKRPMVTCIVPAGLREDGECAASGQEMFSTSAADEFMDGPVLCLRGAQQPGHHEFEVAERGSEHVHERMRSLFEDSNGFACVEDGCGSGRQCQLRTCTECIITVPFRKSLQSFGGRKSDGRARIILTELSGIDALTCPEAMMGDRLACWSSDLVVICVSADQLEPDLMRRELQAIMDRTPHLFTEHRTTGSTSPVVFVVTPSRKNDTRLSSAESALRLGSLISDICKKCPHLPKSAPIFNVDAHNALCNEDETGSCDWDLFAEMLAGSFKSATALVASSRVRRAMCVQTHAEEALSRALYGEVWPLNASTYWAARTEAVLMAGTVSLAVALDIAAAGLSIYAYSAAAVAAANAQAAANTWRAWLFGFGHYTAVAQATQRTATAAANGAAFMTTWSVLDAWFFVAQGAKVRDPSLPSSLISVQCGAAHLARSIGTISAREALATLDFDKPEEENSGKSYNDVLFYPEGMVAWNLENLYFRPFVLRHVVSGRHLYLHGAGVGCTSDVRCHSVMWAKPRAGPGDRTVQIAGINFALVLNVAENEVIVKSAQPKEEEPEPDPFWWDIIPGTSSGSVRLRAASTSDTQKARYLRRGGWIASVREWIVLCEESAHPEQDWVIVPMAPLLIGEFIGRKPNGLARLFWLNGALAWQGSVSGASMLRGLVFDESTACQGYFSLGAAGEPPRPNGANPEQLEDPDCCSLCGRKAQADDLHPLTHFLPCNHGPVCHQCDWFQSEGKRCPHCAGAIHGREYRYV